MPTYFRKKERAHTISRRHHLKGGNLKVGTSCVCHKGRESETSGNSAGSSDDRGGKSGNDAEKSSLIAPLF